MPLFPAEISKAIIETLGIIDPTFQAYTVLAVLACYFVGLLGVVGLGVHLLGDKPKNW